MNDLISRSALLDKFGEEPFVWDDNDLAEIQDRNDWLAYTGLVKAATAVDAVEVVRCKDCYNRNHDGTGKPWCDAWEVYLSDDEDFFCSYGERRAE